MSDEPSGPHQELPKTDPFYQELASLYENPEVFFDPSKPLVPKFRIRSGAVPNQPVILTTEISEDLILALRESAFSMLRSIPGFEEAMQENYGTSSWEETRAKIVDDDYEQGERAMYWFFIRNYPKLTLHIFDIACRITVAYALRHSQTETPDERKMVERDIKKGIATMLANLRKDIHAMLGTKTRGGSTSRLRDDLRKSLHVEYDAVHAISKAVKKQCESLRKTFTASRNRAGADDWRAFWNDSAVKLFPEYEPAYLALFAHADNPSASDVSYIWISHTTGLSQSYVRKKIKELRRLARFTADKNAAPSNEMNQSAAPSESTD